MGKRRAGWVLLAAVTVASGCATGGTGSVDASRNGPDGGDSEDAGGGRDGGGAHDGATDSGGRDSGFPPDAPRYDAGTPCGPGATAPCTTACGSSGVRHCESGVFGPCEAPGEICDGADQDCDGTVDEGLTRDCSTACGSGSETCSAGSWTGCTAPPEESETCDGTDQDCDGTVDEGLTRDCSTACGSGSETCSGGSWGSCTAPMPEAESCNRMDDDCDGRVDDGYQAEVFTAVPISELSAKQPPCDGPNADLDVCMSASARWCNDHSLGCFDGGAGFLRASSTSARVVCFGNEADPRSTTFDAVSASADKSIDNDNVDTRVAQSAVNRYCRREHGAEAGIGPTEHSHPSMHVICLPSSIATYTSLATSELIGEGCDPTSDADTLQCAQAADVLCIGRGHDAGYGPVEWNSTSSVIICLDGG